MTCMKEGNRRQQHRMTIAETTKYNPSVTSIKFLTIWDIQNDVLLHEKQTDQMINRLTNRPTDQPTDLPTNQPNQQPTDRPTNGQSLL